MEQYKQEFIEFMVDCKVLKFGDFVTKSGRKTPFFINTGFYRTGAQLKKLGEYYAEAINNKYGTDFDILFGPAYKGIPLSVTTAIALNDKYGADIGYCSNRKEIKDHGDKGILLGSPIKDGDKIVIIEDVTTAQNQDLEVISTNFYNLQGQKLPYPQAKGLYIIQQKMKDGSIKTKTVLNK